MVPDDIDLENCETEGIEGVAGLSEGPVIPCSIELAWYIFVLSEWVRICRRLEVLGSSASLSAFLLGEFMAISSADASVIFSQEDEGQGVGKWWACEIADWVSSINALMMAIDADMKTQTEGKREKEGTI